MSSCNKEIIIDDPDLRPIFEVGQIDGECAIVGADIKIIATDILTIRNTVNMSGGIRINGTPTFSAGLNILSSSPVYLRNFAFITSTNVFSPAYVFTTLPNKMYFISIESSFIAQGTNGGGILTLYTRAKNSNGVVTINAPGGVSRIADAGFTTADFSFTIAGANIVINIRGVAATRISWNVLIKIIEASN